MKLALITGATAGIGEATAIKMAQNGYSLILTGRRNERLIKLRKKLIEEFNIKCNILCFDIRDKSQVENAFDSLQEERKNIDAETIEEVMKADEMADTSAESAAVTDAPSPPASRKKDGSMPENENLQPLENRLEALETSVHGLIREMRESRTMIERLSQDVRGFLAQQQKWIDERLREFKEPGAATETTENKKPILKAFPLVSLFRKKQ